MVHTKQNMMRCTTPLGELPSDLFLLFYFYFFIFFVGFPQKRPQNTSISHMGIHFPFKKKKNKIKHYSVQMKFPLFFFFVVRLMYVRICKNRLPFDCISFKYPTHKTTKCCSSGVVCLFFFSFLYSQQLYFSSLSLSCLFFWVQTTFVVVGSLGFISFYFFYVMVHT